jgi:hypothetical protein
MRQKASEDEELTRLKAISDLAATRVRLAAQRVRDRIRFEMRYNPDYEAELRIPLGETGGGRWADGGGGGGNRVTRPTRLIATAGDYSVGRLVIQFMTSDGRRCVYRFDFGTIVVPGANNFSCSEKVPSAAVVHGYRLNDN